MKSIVVVVLVIAVAAPAGAQSSAPGKTGTVMQVKVHGVS